MCAIFLFSFGAVHASCANIGFLHLVMLDTKMETAHCLTGKAFIRLRAVTCLNCETGQINNYLNTLASKDLSVDDKPMRY